MSNIQRSATEHVLIEEALNGNRRALARLLSQLENDGANALDLLTALYPHTGCAYLIGITGAPGTGKSTLVTELAKAYRRQGCTVGIVAVDPTSPFTGGAILGDRIRMRDLAGDPGVFIRSMATRGSLGGLARATADVIKALDAAGYQVILIETVGAGQSEVDIARTADTTLVVEAPGMGDEIQAIKAGILEIADVLVVNKADREGAEGTVRALQAMLDLGVAEHKISHHGVTMTVGVPHKGAEAGSQRADSGDKRPEPRPLWRPPILKTVALESKGITEVVQAIQQHRQFLDSSGERERRVRERLAAELEAILRNMLIYRLMSRLSRADLNRMIERIAAREIDPYTAAASLLEHAHWLNF